MAANQAVIECVAFDCDKSGGVNAVNQDGARGYFEAAAVSLYSVRSTNPDKDAVLITNAVVPSDIKRLLNELGCRVIEQPFDSFSFPCDVPWYLAFYKLCALRTVIDLDEYEQVLMLDTDTWVRANLDDVFHDTKFGLMLYRLHPNCCDSDLLKMQEELEALSGNCYGSGDCFFGGEIICGCADDIKSLLIACETVMNQMIKKGVVSERGDEFLLFASAAERLLPPVVSANPYIQRLWTGRYWSVTSRWSDLKILHLPAEKVFSFPRAFKVLLRNRSINGCWFERSCGLRVGRRPFSPLWICKRSLDKLLNR